MYHDPIEGSCCFMTSGGAGGSETGVTSTDSNSPSEKNGLQHKQQCKNNGVITVSSLVMPVLSKHKKLHETLAQ